MGDVGHRPDLARAEPLHGVSASTIWAARAPLDTAPSMEGWRVRSPARIRFSAAVRGPGRSARTPASGRNCAKRCSRRLDQLGRLGPGVAGRPAADQLGHGGRQSLGRDVRPPGGHAGRHEHLQAVGCAGPGDVRGLAHQVDAGSVLRIRRRVQQDVAPPVERPAQQVGRAEHGRRVAGHPRRRGLVDRGEEGRAAAGSTASTTWRASRTRPSASAHRGHPGPVRLERLDRRPGLDGPAALAHGRRRPLGDHPHAVARQDGRPAGQHGQQEPEVPGVRAEVAVEQDHAEERPEDRVDRRLAEPQRAQVGLGGGLGRRLVEEHLGRAVTTSPSEAGEPRDVGPAEPRHPQQHRAGRRRGSASASPSQTWTPRANGRRSRRGSPTARRKAGGRGVGPEERLEAAVDRPALAPDVRARPPTASPASTTWTVRPAVTSPWAQLSPASPPPTTTQSTVPWLASAPGTAAILSAAPGRTQDRP